MASALLAAGLCVSGWLTRKGPDREQFWAITDAQGMVWKITNPTDMRPGLLATVEQRQVAAVGTRDRTGLVAGLKVRSLGLGHCPGSG
jgi:hypothetical protein